MEEKLQYLLDRREIEDQMIHYAHIIDNKKFDSLEEVFVPDGFIDYHETGGAVGKVPEISEYLKQSMSTVLSQHSISNIECDISPDRKSARTRCMLFNPMHYRLKKGDLVFFVGLWYNCDWVMTDSGWKITSMVQEIAYNFNRPEV